MQAVLEYIQQMRTPIFYVLGITFFMYLVMLLLMRTMKLYMTKWWVPLYFVGLNRRSVIHTGAAWVKLTYLIGVLAASACSQSIHYWVLGLLALIVIIMGCDLRSLLFELVGDGILGAGMLVCSFLLRYLLQVRNSAEIRAAYWFLSILLGIAALLVFVRETTRISTERKYFNELDEINYEP